MILTYKLWELTESLQGDFEAFQTKKDVLKRVGQVFLALRAVKFVSAVRQLIFVIFI
jgi:hypothetical protein